MDTCQHILQEARQYPGYVDTVRRLLDGLIMYRRELGETGHQLELLLRCRGVVASTDLHAHKRLQ